MARLKSIAPMPSKHGGDHVCVLFAMEDGGFKFGVIALMALLKS